MLPTHKSESCFYQLRQAVLVEQGHMPVYTAAGVFYKPEI